MDIMRIWKYAKSVYYHVKCVLMRIIVQNVHIIIIYLMVNVLHNVSLVIIHIISH